METLQRRIRKPNPRRTASWPSRITHWYLNDIFKKGYKKQLGVEDMYDVLEDYNSENLATKACREWRKELQKKENSGRPNLFSALFKLVRTEIMLMGMVLFIEVAARTTAPVLLGWLLDFFTPNGKVTWREAYFYAMGIGLIAILIIIIRHPVLFAMEMAQLKQRAAATTLIYSKLLSLSQSAFSETSSCQIMNLTSIDAQKLLKMYQFAHYLWIGPLHVIAITVLLWLRLGPTSLIGVGVIVILTPFRGCLWKLSCNLRRKVVTFTEERVKMMTEIISWMKFIKMYAWEDPFLKFVSKIRRKEFTKLLKATQISAINASVQMSVPYIAILVMFSIHYFSGNQLTVSLVFTSIALLQTLTDTAAFLNLGVQFFSEGYSSTRRIQEFLELNEKKSSDAQRNHLNSERLDPYVLVKDLSASWKERCINHTLQKINFEVNKEKPLLMIAGPAGCGKTSLLMAVSGELPVSNGNVSLNGSVAYISQQSWIFSASVRENILFGKSFDSDKYSRVIYSCALVEDFQELPKGDLTHVGERGVPLSDGQKARISLARAVYHDADIYLVDDSFRAIDAKMGKHIFEQCICGLLKSKLRIVVTNQIQHLRFATEILCIKEGKPLAFGSYKKFMEHGIDVRKVLLDGPPEEKDWDRDSAVDFEEVKIIGGRKPRLNSISDSFRSFRTDSFTDSVSHVNPGFTQEEIPLEVYYQAKGDDIEVSEESQKGESIGLIVYLQYFAAGAGIIMAIMLLLICIFGQFTFFCVDWWLGMWAQQEENRVANRTVTLNLFSQDNREDNFYVFVGIGCVAVVVSLMRSMFFFTLLVNASQKLHNIMLSVILNVPIYFFRTNSVGKILSRFSKDMYIMDDELPLAFFDVVQYTLLILNILLVNIVNVPHILVIVVPLLIIYILLRRYFLRTLWQVRRLETVSQAPMYHHLATSLEGLTSIRAYRKTNDAAKEFYKCQDHQSEGWFLILSTTRWFALRVDAISSVFIIVCAFALIVLKDYTKIDAALVGLGLSYAFMLFSMFHWCVEPRNQVENMMTSVDRVIEYCGLDPERDEEDDEDVTDNWPKYGIITAEGASFAHHQSLPYVLKTLFFCIRANEKVGIVGRKGAGKSSLISALFRMGELKGTMRIDGVPTSDVPLKDLRSKISVVPQRYGQYERNYELAPVLFSGTLRMNLDPFDQFADSDLWECLEEVQLKDLVMGLPKKLDTFVTEGGSLLDVGQHQLFCLGKAVLRRNKILVIEEAIANVDNETEILIHQTVREKFRECTVITVAHRLKTVMDSDRVMVLDEGKIVEFEEPNELLKNNDSRFKRLVDQTGRIEAARLELLAHEAKELRAIMAEQNRLTFPGCTITKSRTKEELLEMFGNRIVYETSV